MPPLLPTTRRPDIAFFPNGKIDITARIARTLNLHPGDVINIAPINGEYFLFVSVRAEQTIGRHEATIYATKHRSHNFRTYSRRLYLALRSTQPPNSPPILRFATGPATNLAIGIAVPIITRINLQQGQLT